MTTQLPFAVRQLCARYRTQAGSTRRASHEFHTLTSLSQRLLLSPAETLNEVSAGRLLALDSRNGSHLFSSTSLDSIRNRTVDFIASSIVTELSRRGCDEETMFHACQRAFDKQFDLARGRGENVIQFDQDNGSGFVNGVGTGVGIAAGGLGAYGAYRYWKNRKRNPDGTPQLPGPDADGSYIDVTPKPNLPPGGNAVDPYKERHPGDLPLDKSRAALTTASPTSPDLLTQAVRKGKAAIATRGSRLLGILKSLPLE
jgi:hypothetical protein